MSNICIKMCLGIGDLLFYSSILSRYKDKYKNAIVCPDFSLLGFKNDNLRELHKDFVRDFCAIIFDKDYFIFDYSLVANRIDPNNMCSLYKLEPCLKDFSNNLCSNFFIDLEKYIVVTTKIRGVNKHFYNERIKNNFIESLKNISNKYKIVILGERNLRSLGV